MRCDDGTAAALNHGALGVGADDGQAPELARIQGEHALVLQEHDALGRGAPGQCPVFGSVFRALFLRFRVRVQYATTREQAEESPYLVVDDGLVDLALAHGTHQGVAPAARRPGHFEIESARGVGHGFQRRPPIADHYAREAPLGFEYVAQEFRVTRRIGAVDPVVGRHHRAHSGFADRGLEGHQIEFAQRGFADLAADAMALELRVVADEMLHAGRHP